MDLAIETSDLTKKYGSLTAVNKLDLKVKRSTIHGFLGPNGAGKTTTIKILVGLLRPNEGTVKVLGQELHGVKSAGFLQSFYEQADSRLSIGYMPELPKFPKHLKGSELLDIYGQMYGMTQKQRKEQIPKLIGLFRSVCAMPMRCCIPLLYLPMRSFSLPLSPTNSISFGICSFRCCWLMPYICP